jgi:ATP-dependent Clp protease protease subunit
MNLKFFKNQSEGVYEMSLRGIVGEDIDGDAIAAEIDFLNMIGATVIKERINSVGGGMINGLSVAAANLNSKAEIHTINEGMAGSIMSIILATGTPGKRFAKDYSTAVIHDPSYNGVTLEDIVDEKEKEDTAKLKESLVQLYANTTKMTKTQARKVMTADTMLNASEQLEKGLIDEVLTSKRKPILTKNMSYSEIMNVCEDKNKFTNINKKVTKMSELKKFYNLHEDASDAAILELARKDRSEKILFENKVKALEKSGDEKDAEISNLKSEVDKYKNEAIVELVKADIKAGKFLAENEESLVENAKSIGIEAYKSFSENVAPKAVNVLNQINTGGEGGEKDTKEEKLAKEWQNLIENDKSEATRIKLEEPDRFKKLTDAWNNVKLETEKVK